MSSHQPPKKAARPAAVVPKLIDPKGVQLGIHARPMATSSDESRAYTASQTQGEPLTSFAGTSNPYVDYQSIDLLLSLQHPRSQGYDENLFFIMGQVKELLFKALHFELHNARHQINQDQVDEAILMLSRAREIAAYIASSWDVLSTISAKGFNDFRDHLGQASGQLSFMYRHVEFILGNKSEKLAQAHSNMPHVWPAMQEALQAPGLYDRIIALLARQGHVIAPHCLDRDWSKPYVADASVENAWMVIYRDQDKHAQMYRLAEMLLQLDDTLSQYRWRHFVSVRRIIGYKPGTGGSAGVGWLRHVTELLYFPELWALRTQL